MMTGDHIRIRQGGGSLHGIDVGDRTAIVFDHGVGPRRIRLEPLADGARVEVVTHIERVHAPKQVVARAFSRFSEAAYAAMFADSEAFAVWCKTGRPAPAAFTSPAPAIAPSGKPRAPRKPMARGERPPAAAPARPAEARVRKAKPKATKKPASPPRATRKKASPRKAAPEPAASRRKVKKRPVTARASAPPKPRAGGKNAARPGKTRKQPTRGGAKAPRRSPRHPHRG